MFLLCSNQLYVSQTRKLAYANTRADGKAGEGRCRPHKRAASASTGPGDEMRPNTGKPS